MRELLLDEGGGDPGRNKGDMTDQSIIPLFLWKCVQGIGHPSSGQHIKNHWKFNEGQCNEHFFRNYIDFCIFQLVEFLFIANRADIHILPCQGSLCTWEVCEWMRLCLGSSGRGDVQILFISSVARWPCSRPNNSKPAVEKNFWPWKIGGREQAVNRP